MLILLFASISAPAQERTPSLSFGLNGISDWSTQHPFLDIMKTARPWIGHLPNQWGGVSFEDLQSQNVLDAEGWPTRIPDNVTKLEALILTDQPKEAVHLGGTYHVFYDGNGDLEITGRGRTSRSSEGEMVFEYRPGPGSVGVAIKKTNVDDPIRNIRIIRAEHLPEFKKGHLFNPLWLHRLGQVDVIRFLDWMATNNSAVSKWDDRPLNTDFSYVWRGVPLPVMIDLANALDADPWFTLPHLANDDAVRKTAELTLAKLKPDRVAHVEFSNEVWNFIFEQARWSAKQSEALWGEIDGGWMQHYGLRSAQVMDIWTEVYGALADERLKRVVSVHTGWPELEQSILKGDATRQVLGRDPVDSFDAYAVTGYFGYELGDPATTSELLSEAERRAESEGKSKGLSRVALREYVSEHRLNGVFQSAAQIVRDGSLNALKEELWPYHAEVAASNGLELMMYEGGTHAAVHWDELEDERLVSFLQEFSYSTEMGDLYAEALSAWSDIAGSSFNAFVDVAAPSQWGSWGALRHLDDDNPRWRALRGHLSHAAD